MIVVDSSIAFKWLRTKDEQFVQEALLLLTNHLKDKETIIVPQLLFLEIANALLTKTDTSTKQITIDLNKLFEAKLDSIPIEQEEINSAVKLAKKHKTSVYDMLYAVIAKKNKCILITADEKFIAKTHFRFAKHISQVKIRQFRG